MKTLVIAAFVAVSMPLLAGSALANEDFGGDRFSTPSGNIGCFYTPAGDGAGYPATLFCDRQSPSLVRYNMAERGPIALERDVMDSPGSNLGDVLEYGAVWQEGPFTCKSSEAGLTCTRNDGHGFFMSRAKLRHF